MAEREVLNDIGLIFRFFKCKVNELGYCTRLTLLCGEKHGMCLPQAYDQPARLLGQCWPTFKKTLAVLPEVPLRRIIDGYMTSMSLGINSPVHYIDHADVRNLHRIAMNILPQGGQAVHLLPQGGQSALLFP